MKNDLKIYPNMERDDLATHTKQAVCNKMVSLK